MDVFTLTPQAEAFLRDAATHAAFELGLFTLLDGGPLTIDALARRANVRGVHRLRALVDVLAWHGAVVVDTGMIRQGTIPPRPATPPPMGYGLLADAIANDRPLATGAADVAYHRHLVDAGADGARALAGRLVELGARRVCDLGGGAGVYTGAFLAACPDGEATLVDRPEVIALAAARLGERARLVAADLFQAEIPPHDAALLVNVTHLYSLADCARLVAVAAAAAPIVVLKDMYVRPDRGGPARGLHFALNMALYTQGGDVHDPDALAGLLTGAGLVDVTSERVGEDVVVVGRRAQP